MPLPIVAIVGRPNVGKSTLFNRLIKRQQAIVDNMPGVTRDRLYRPSSWAGVDFMLVDTGGLWVGDADPLATKVTEQARIAIEQADVVVFLLDSQVGPQDADVRIAKELKRSGKNVIIAPNKVDQLRDEFSASEFYSLGFEQIFPVSAANGRNIGDLLDAIVQNLPKGAIDEFQEDIKVAIVGRPNVGKSSLVNAMTGQNITIVAPIAGTTRDAIDTQFELKGTKYLLIDTAGLKKKNIYKDDLEFYTKLRTLRAISRADIAVVVIDSLDGLVVGDLRIANEATSLFKSVIFAVNKWDAYAEKDADTVDKLSKGIVEKAPSLKFVPIIFISALTGLRVQKVWEMIYQVSLERKKRIPTAELNAFFKSLTEKYPPPAKAGRLIKILYVTQAEGDPPTFIIFTNHPKYIEIPYQRFLENRIREAYGFSGTPIKFVFKDRK
jgi:GTP-binding protein